MKEIWKDIKEFEKRYQVSNLGRVKSLSKFVNNNPNYSSIGYYTKERILKPFKNAKGYQLVKLYKDKVSYNKKIHRLVAEAFIPNLKNKPQINHIDGSKNNNNANNLEWCTNKENQEHAWKNNLKKRIIGKDNKLSKNVYQYDLKGNFIKEWNCVEEAQKTLKISNISTVCYGKRKQAGGYIWKYYSQ